MPTFQPFTAPLFRVESAEQFLLRWAESPAGRAVLLSPPDAVEEEAPPASQRRPTLAARRAEKAARAAALLAEHNGNAKAAARAAGVPLATFRYRLKVAA